MTSSVKERPSTLNPRPSCATNPAMAGDIKLHDSWRDPLAEEFASPYMTALREFQGLPH